jgi:hypothetical protein
VLEYPFRQIEFLVDVARVGIVRVWADRELLLGLPLQDALPSLLIRVYCAVLEG